MDNGEGLGMEKTLSVEVERPEAVNSPAFWQNKLDIHNVLHGMICLANGWNRTTTVTQSAYELTVKSMSFTAR